MAAEAAAKVPGMGAVRTWTPVFLLAVGASAVATMGAAPAAAAGVKLASGAIGTVGGGMQVGAAKLAGLAPVV
jgi:hypothetical protein